jgi:tetratricopeptide (TPR) repeat protein
MKIQDDYAGFDLERGRGMSELQKTARVRAFVAKYPQSLSGWSTLAIYETSAGHVDDAWSSGLKAVKIADQFPADRQENFGSILRKKLYLTYLNICSNCEKFMNYIGGLKWAKRFTVVCPDRGMAWMNLGDFYSKLGQDDEALQAYSQGARAEPNSYVWKYAEIRFMLQLMEKNAPSFINSSAHIDKVENGVKWLQTQFRDNGQPITSGDPVMTPFHVFTEIWTSFGRCEQLRENYEKAEQFFAKAAGFDPNNPYNNAAWGKMKFSQGNITEAHFLLKKSFQTYETAPEVAILIGKIANNQGDSQLAMNMFSKAVKMGEISQSLNILPQDPRYQPLTQLIIKDIRGKSSTNLTVSELQRLLQLYMQMGLELQASRCCEALKAKNQADFHILNTGAVLASKLFQLDKAVEWHKELTRVLNRGSVRIQGRPLPTEVMGSIRANSAMVLLKQGKNQEALAVFESILRTYPNHLMTALYKMRVLYLENRFSDALNLYRPIQTRLPRESRQFSDYFVQCCQIAKERLKEMGGVTPLKKPQKKPRKKGGFWGLGARK